MLNVFWKVTQGILSLVKIPFYILVGCMALFVFLCTIWLVIGLISGKRFKKPGFLKDRY